MNPPPPTISDRILFGMWPAPLALAVVIALIWWFS